MFVMEVRSKVITFAFRVLVFFHNHVLDPDAEQPLQSEDGILESHSDKSTNWWMIMSTHAHGTRVRSPATRQNLFVHEMYEGLERNINTSDYRIRGS